MSIYLLAGYTGAVLLGALAICLLTRAFPFDEEEPREESDEWPPQWGRDGGDGRHTE